MDRSDSGRELHEYQNEIWATPYQVLFKDKKNGVPEAVAISEDGERAYFQRIRDGATELVECPLGGLGNWLNRKFNGPQTLCVLPATAAALDINADGSQLAIGIDKQVYTWSREQGLRPLLTLPDSVGDLAYLSDGSLAIQCTWKSHSQYYHLPHGSSKAMELFYDELEPEQYEATLREGLSRLGPIAQGSASDLLALRDRLPWLFKDGKALDYNAATCQGSDQVAVLSLNGNDSDLRILQPASGDAVQLTSFKQKHPSSFQMMRSADGSHLAVWEKPPASDMEALVNVYVWDMKTKQMRVVPNIADVLVNNQEHTLNFADPSSSSGQRVDLALDQVAALNDKPWYQAHLSEYLRSNEREVLGGQTDHTPPPEGDVTRHERYLDVGGVRVPMHGVELPPPPPQAQPAVPTAASVSSPAVPSTAENAELAALTVRLREARQTHTRLVAETAAAEHNAQAVEGQLQEWMLAHGFARGATSAEAPSLHPE